MKITRSIFIVACIACLTIFSLKNQREEIPSVNIDNIEALARNESTNECHGCIVNLYICRIYGDWGGCLGTETMFNV